MQKKQDDWSVVKMLTWATGYFEQHRVDSPRLSIEWLLSHILGLKRLDLYMQHDRPLTSQELEQLKPLIKRRQNHEPLQYITGSTDFYNVQLNVTPDVLIPRPETEQLLELILADAGDLETFSLLDLGTGSGCIPIAAKHERPHWKISAIELSEAALNIARQNSAQNQTDISFYHQDFTSEWPQELAQLDVIVSNPPYVLDIEKETLEPQVRDFEPALALFTSDLSKIYGPIASQSARRLKKSGLLYVEIHENYAEKILPCFEASMWEIELKKDYSGKARFIKARLIR